MPGEIVRVARVMVAGRPHHGAVVARRRDVGIVPGGCIPTREVFVGEVTEVRDQRLRRKGFTRVVRGAVRLATPALRARVEVERVLPREVLERAGSEVLVRLALRV